MNRAQRLIGIDLFRGIASFAVVILHSDELIKQAPPAWTFAINFSAFAVPFFLATSFYLLVDKLYRSAQPLQWQTRFSRLLVPYAFWSAVYLGINTLRFLQKHQTNKIQNLWTNLPEVMILGKAAFHLYFIPLLIVGTLLIMVIEPWLRKRPGLIVSLALFLLGLIAYQLYREFLEPVALAASAPIQSLRHNPAHANKLLSIGLRVLGFLMRCLPYIGLALVLNHPLIKTKLFRFNGLGISILGILFILFNTWHTNWIPQGLQELMKGYTALLLGIGISSHLKTNAMIASVGQCSFGIYLMHLIVVDVCWSVLEKVNVNINQVSVLILLSVTFIGFGLSWIATALLLKRKSVSNLMFGS